MLNVVLFEPQIPPNTGNIARLTAGLGLRLHLIHPLGFSTDDKQLKRAGLDYWEYVDLVHHDSLDDFYKSLPGARFFYLSTHATRSYCDVKYEKGDCLVFGPETKGLPKDLLEKNKDWALTIPMNGKIRSLNLSSAVAMVVGEAVRQIRGSCP